ncbi:MAG: leuS [Parcubacteria group bacterium]|nr:leuS [Parcubacteria group bacterium]
MREYDPKEIEAKWQEYWVKNKIHEATDDVHKPKYYSLVEFPYPSGEGLHVGHPRPYIGMDVVSRKRRMEGYNVLYPMGFDAFGLPAENYAIKTGIHPSIITKENIQKFKKQIESLGLSFDWSREVNTSDPAYYKWTQWLFLKFLEHDLAYKAKMTINWCPKDKIGLANEEVIDGKCERCGTVVEKREKEQWMLAITKYADRLDKDLDLVDFSERVKTQQRNWIGRSTGLVFTSPVKDTNLSIETFSAHFEAFCADTFVVIAPDHPLLSKLLEGIQNKEDILEAASKMLQARMLQGHDEVKEVEGIFTGRYTVDPVGNGELPIWIANYALADYGTGIVKCSAHDERDFAFAKKYDLYLKPVMFPEDPGLKERVKNLEVCYTDMKKGILSFPKEFEGRKAGDARQEIIDYCVAHNLARPEIKFKLRDWVFSRQRYWGEPIPVIHCEKCGMVAVPESDLPVLLPEVEKYEPTDTGESPLANISEWVNTTCPKCGGPGKRETDTMPNWAGSSWYFLRYTDPHNDAEFASRAALDHWTPVDWYNGGMEHTTLHLLYSRFWHKFFFDIGLVPTSEPYARRTSHGFILAENGEKMSKSRGNVVNPNSIVERYGADTLRLYEMFMGPFEQAISWSEGALIGPRRFIERVWKLSDKVGDREMTASEADREIERNRTIKKVSTDIETLGFNTAVSALMMYANSLEKKEFVFKTEFETLLKLLAPFVPHVSEELWAKAGNTDPISLASWPEFDEDKLHTELTTLALQINGKTRSTFEVSFGALEEEIREIALALPETKKWLNGAIPKKVIVVVGKIVNLVV